MKLYVVKPEFDGVVDIYYTDMNTLTYTRKTLDEMLETNILVSETRLQKLLKTYAINRTTGFEEISENEYYGLLESVPVFRYGRIGNISYTVTGEPVTMDLHYVIIELNSKYYRALKPKDVSSDVINEDVAKLTSNTTIFKHFKFINTDNDVNIKFKKVDAIINHFYTSTYSTRMFETFRIYAFDNSLRVLGYLDFMCWSQVSTLVNIKMAVKFLIDLTATRYATIHNHPSQTDRITISPHDYELVQKIATLASLLKIEWVDNVVITSPDNRADVKFKTFS